MSDEQNKIIVVDDNMDILGVIRNILKDDYEVYPCPSAAKMFIILEHVKPDLILLDVEMPEINGYEAAKKLKSNTQYNEIPIIFLTSMVDEQSEIEGLSIGAVDYIRKPIVIPLFLQRIKTHLSLLEQKKIILARNKEIEELLELKTNEIKLREKAEQEAQNASRAKSDFLSHMSHEIRSPLNAVMGMINIVTEKNDIQTIKIYLEKAGNAAKQVLGVINDILDISKIEANKFELSSGEFNFRKMITTIVDVTSIRAQEKHHNIKVNLDPVIPSFIISDELRLAQVITNLMANAVKFTPENGTVELNAQKLEEKDDEVTIRIEVADSGIGISPVHQKKLFTSYSQADNNIAQKYGGTGLGLVISKQIVELMQGTIWIESELKKGSKFIFTIKAKKGTGEADNASGAEQIATDYDFKGYTILVAEDIEINREVLAMFLEKTGVSIEFAENGKIIVDMFKANQDKYSLILMDIHMPEMDGNEATRIIRSLNNKKAKQIPIIAMTADVFKEDVDKCLASGMNDHIAKPIIPEIVLAKIKQYIGEKAG